MALPTRDEVLDAIRECGRALGRAPSRSEFRSRSRMTEYQILQHFPSWREALHAAGLEADSTNIRLEDDVLLSEWGEFVRRVRHIPTRHLYRREGKYSPGAFEKHFGPWSAIPERFREFAKDKPEWADVVALLPLDSRSVRMPSSTSRLSTTVRPSATPNSHIQHSKLSDRPPYGNPMDFRGLRHEPVNEDGVVFLFGMVARELGYLVEAVQAGFPDCEAKRQIGPGKWQRVRIEFEFESRNFRDPGHPHDGCDLIVCWRHNWPDCPPHLEVVELSTVIRTLSAADE